MGHSDQQTRPGNVPDAGNPSETPSELEEVTDVATGRSAAHPW